jgi:hypothetical protein
LRESPEHALDIARSDFQVDRRFWTSWPSAVFSTVGIRLMLISQPGVVYRPPGPVPGSPSGSRR